MAIPTFVDRVTLHVAAGRGGNGVASVHREKFKPLGGPDGGNGGPGGSVILRVEPDVTTLVDYHHSPKRRAEHGGHGAGGHRNGGHGSDLVLPVPDGTVVTTRAGEVLADMVGPGSELVVAPGRPRRARQRGPGVVQAQGPRVRAARRAGRRARHRARAQGRRRHRAGGLPERRQVQPDRRDVAGAAQDRRLPVHDAVPNLGVVTAGDTTFTVADVPGLIEGASEGRGLGHDFLRHIERCAALVHVVDTATMEPGRNPVDDLDVIENELTPVRRARGPAATGRAEQDRRARRPRPLRHRAGGPRGPRAASSSRCPPRPARDCASSPSRCPPSSRRRAPRSRSPRRPGSCCARPAPTAPTTSRSRRPARAGECAGRSPSGGSGRPTSATTRRSASSPTGSTGSASRRSWSRWARSRATRC